MYYMCENYSTHNLHNVSFSVRSTGFTICEGGGKGSFMNRCGKYIIDTLNSQTHTHFTHTHTHKHTT